MAQPASLKHDRPPSAIPGWAAAWAVLDRVENYEQRHALELIVRGLGVQGAPAMEHAATTAVRLAGLGLPKPPRKALSTDVVHLIERRVADELRKVDPKVFPLSRVARG